MSRPFWVGANDLRRAVATREPVVRSGSLGELQVIETRVGADRAVEVSCVCEAAGSDLVVRGRVRTSWTAPCRRCSDPLTGEVDVDVREVFTRDAVEGDTYAFDGNELDLAEMVRDTVMLELPLAPGPPVDDADVCLVCGRGPVVAVDDAAPVEDEPDAARDERGDPRWAVLDQLDDLPGGPLSHDPRENQ